MSTQPHANAASSTRYAAIDIGTVTCRLLVADVTEEGVIEEVLRKRAICNLGEGVDESGRLLPEAIERVGAAVESFLAAMGEVQLDGPIPVRAVATSASRDAENSDEFRDRLARAGLELDIVPGEGEAALSFAGASSAFSGERIVVLDVGGGSTEIIAGIGGGAPEFARSFNVGCRRVTERCFEQDPPTPENLQLASEWIDAELSDYLRELEDAGCLTGRMIAVAGTATSVVSMREEMAVYDSSRVHGSVVTRSDVDAAFDRLSHMTTEERRHVTGLHPGRAPVIVAGMLILQRIMSLSDAESFTVSERDILHGIIMSQIGKVASS